MTLEHENAELKKEIINTKNEKLQVESELAEHKLCEVDISSLKLAMEEIKKNKIELESKYLLVFPINCLFPL